ncbi:hypothetical protein ACVWZK_007149 [Bradyrhizobium sp. GM0.4]
MLELSALGRQDLEADPSQRPRDASLRNPIFQVMIANHGEFTCLSGRECLRTEWRQLTISVQPWNHWVPSLLPH